MAEVLIALALLGIIAAFAIPKVLQSVENQRRRALFKETYALLSEVIYTGVFTGKSPQEFTPYVLSKVNAVKICDTNSISQACWSGASNSTTVTTESGEPGFVLANGTVVSGFNQLAVERTSGEYSFAFAMDWNGDALPNRLGEDQLLLSYCFGSRPCYSFPAVGNLKPGQIGPYPVIGAEAPVNLALYNTLFTD